MKPTEFAKLVKVQEAENQIVTDYVSVRRPLGTHFTPIHFVTASGDGRAVSVFPTRKASGYQK